MKVGEGNNTKSHKSSALLLTVYSLTILVYIIASFFPEQRLWAWNTFAFLSPTVRYSFLGLALVFPIIGRWITLSWGENKSDEKKYNYFLIIFAVLSVICFYLLRVKFYVLGDGYALLDLLNLDNPIIKTHELGESYFHLFIKNVAAGFVNDAALFSFQFVSILSGFFFVLIAAVGARKLFENFAQRILFVLAILSGGQTLLFFGYVENYSLFAISVLLYSIFLLFENKNSSNKLVVVALNLVAILFHIFGVALIPATIYFCLRDTRIGKKIARMEKLSLLLIFLGLSIVTLATFAYFYQQSLFLRYSILPIVPNEFTTEGYFLFSLKHLADFVNLFFLLIPGAGLVLLFLSKQWKSISLDKGMVSLIVASVVGLAFAFFFDPKIGMPRDWDLFSFAAVPLVVFVSFSVTKIRSRFSLTTIILIIGLGFLSLFSRVMMLNDQAASIDCTLAYFDLDKRKNMNSFGMVHELLTQQGDILVADKFQKEYVKTFVEIALNDEGKWLLNQKRYNEALAKFDEALKVNPSMGSVYFNRGLAYGRMGEYSKAIEEFEIVRSIHSYNARFPANISYVYLQMQRYNEAGKYAQLALSLNKKELLAIRSLYQVYKQTGDRQNYMLYLTMAANHPEVTPLIILELAEVFARSGNLKKSADYLNMAINAGLDSNLLNRFLKMYPNISMEPTTDTK